MYFEGGRFIVEKYFGAYKKCRIKNFGIYKLGVNNDRERRRRTNFTSIGCKF